ncbi:MAG: hypothetical protein ACE5KM_17730 [Planctomycetaceae bacterium]
MKHIASAVVCFATVSSAVGSEPIAKKPLDKRHAVAVKDGRLIAEWLWGRDPGKVFKSKFADRTWLTKGKDVVLYTDICGLKAPKGSRRVTYEAIRARMAMLKGAHKVSPAVLIVKSTRKRPKGSIQAIQAEERIQKGVPTLKELNARYYYVEVGIGNLAWYWIRIAVYEFKGKTRVRFLSHSMS